MFPACSISGSERTTLFCRLVLRIYLHQRGFITCSIRLNSVKWFVEGKHFFIKSKNAVQTGNWRRWRESQPYWVVKTRARIFRQLYRHTLSKHKFRTNRVSSVPVDGFLRTFLSCCFFPLWAFSEQFLRLLCTLLALHCAIFLHTQGEK